MVFVRLTLSELPYSNASDCSVAELGTGNYGPLLAKLLIIAWHSVLRGFASRRISAKEFKLLTVRWTISRKTGLGAR